MNKIKIKLDKTDKRILTELDVNCRIPLTKLAKKVRKSRQSVEYRINQLVKKNVITQFNASINLHKIGCKIYKIFLKIKNKPSEIKELLSYLRKAPEVWWLGETDGQWDVIFAAFFRTDFDFFKFKNKLISRFNNIIIKHYGTSHIDVRQYPKMYFMKKILQPTLFGGRIVDNKLDSLDFSILKNIVNNARISINKLAEKINSTPIIIRNRLKKLEKKGIIIQYRISIDLDKLDLEHYKAVIHLDRYSKEDEKKMFYYIGNIPNVIYFIRDLWRIELEFITENYKEYNAIINDLKKEFPDIIRNVESLYLKTDEWTTGFENLVAKKG